MTDNRDHTTDAQTYPAKVWISTDYVPDSFRKWLTPGKRYEVTKAIYDSDGYILDDEGELLYSRFKSSEWLDGRDWTVHTEPLPASAPEMQVWHDEPGPQPSPPPGFGFVIASALAFGLGALIMWMVTR